MTSHRWKRFFIDAGLPSDVADNYAIIFTDNRIRFDMLDEINKEILYDMKIKKMGDVISILRHAKAVHSNSQREKVFNNNNNDEDISLEKESKITTPSIKTVSQPDSTNNNNIITQKQINSTRIVKIPSPKRIVKVPSNNQLLNNNNNNNQNKNNQLITKTNTVFPKRKTSPTIIRNVTGLNSIIPTTTTTTITKTIRKRIEPPSDDDNDVSTTKSIKTSNVNPQIRNKIDAQSRLRKFSNQIQNAIISNVSADTNLLQQQSTIIRNRQSRFNNINKNDILFGKTIQQKTDSIIKNSSNIKDRLGNKSVFDRIGKSQQQSIHNRLGTK